LRVKYPYIRGALLDLWKKAGGARRPGGGLEVAGRESRRAAALAAGARQGRISPHDWDTVLEIIAASNIHTIKAARPDRIAGFSPIPAMSMISYASGARLLQLDGRGLAVVLRLVLRSAAASPETWGEQTDVHESADWYNAKLLAVMGEPEHDPHAGLPLRGRGAAQRLEDVGVLAGLQPGGQVCGRVGGDQRRPGRRVVDGGEPRAAEGIPSREEAFRISSTTRRSTRTLRTWSS
jgi:hypothetical protein